MKCSKGDKPGINVSPELIAEATAMLWRLVISVDQSRAERAQFLMTAHNQGDLDDLEYINRAMALVYWGRDKK